MTSCNPLSSKALPFVYLGTVKLGFERALPLRKPSRLADEQMARKLLALSEGSLGELSTLLTSAAIYAVQSGGERIDEKVLAAIDWAPPSERRRRAERLV
jgi:hypothetical protein